MYTWPAEVRAFSRPTHFLRESPGAVLFNFSSASYYQATFMVIQVVKEDCNFAAKALLTISMVITFARGGRNPGRNPLYGDPLIL